MGTVIATLLAAGTKAPADARFGLILILLVLIGGVVMTAVVFVRNRRPTPPPAHSDPPELPDHPG